MNFLRDLGFSFRAFRARCRARLMVWAERKLFPVKTAEELELRIRLLDFRSELEQRAHNAEVARLQQRNEQRAMARAEREARQQADGESFGRVVVAFSAAVFPAVLVALQAFGKVALGTVEFSASLSALALGAVAANFRVKVKQQ